MNARVFFIINFVSYLKIFLSFTKVPLNSHSHGKYNSGKSTNISNGDLYKIVVTSWFPKNVEVFLCPPNSMIKCGFGGVFIKYKTL